jgi:conjugal transfer ATP-binding protein TraC
MSYLSLNGQAWVIDIGRSYEKLNQLYGGDFMVFGRDSSLCLNPFELVECYDEEADMLSGLVAVMAAPKTGLSDYQTASLRRVMKAVWARDGRGMTVDAIATALLESDEARVRDIGQQLFSFTSAGELGRFFNGRNTLRFANPFTVLELDELKGRPHLQQVVLLQLMYQIQARMIDSPRDHPKILVIDEAWSLLTQGSGVSAFIEGAYRRYRKYGGACVVVTQGVNDLWGSNAGRAIVENSPNLYLLGQSEEAINALQRDQRLALPEGAYAFLKTVHSVPGRYAEIFFRTEYGMGIGRLYVDRFRQLLYSTRPEEVEAINRGRTAGLSVEQAIRRLMEDPDAG